MNGWRTLVVEDVALMCEALVDLLRVRPEIGTIDTAGNIAAASALLDQHRYDLILLDVHLPDGDGVVLGASAASSAVVYCTADPAFAIEAFKQEAVDYLLKPITADALCEAIDRVHRRRGTGGVTRPPLAVREGASLRFIAIELIERVEAAGHYQCVHAGGEVHLVRQPSARVADALGPGFVRAHRSLLVRADAVRTMLTERSGDGTLTLASGATVRFSRSFREDLAAAIGPR